MLIRRIPIAPALLLAALALGPVALAGKDEDKAAKAAWEEAKKLFLTEFASPDPKVRRAAVYKIREFADLGAAELVADEIFGKETNFGVLDAAGAVLGAARNPEVVGWIVRQATGRGGWQLRAPMTEALGSIPLPESKEAVRKLLEDEKDARVLSMALFSAESLGMKDDVDLVLPHLEHEDWQVRVAAIEALASFKLDRTIEPLIDRLMNERGRLREDLADALKKITGKDFGRDANLWRKWYRERDQVKEPEPAPAKPEPGGSVADDGPTYFGLRVNSDRVLFIIDVSMSMKTPIDVDKMKIAREAALTGGDKDDDDKDTERFEDTIQWWKIKDRLDLAKAQLAFVVKNLKADQQFEIASFSKTVTPWNGGRLRKATPRAALKAIPFIDALDVEEDTAAGAVLDWAFEMAGPGAGDRNYKTGVDTIFFLSDGAPSDRPEDEILEEVSGRNRLRKIRIHVVAIMNYSVRFLRLLAEKNGGIYKFFQVEDKK